MARLLKDEAGYSLVEVMVSIMILTIAIIPMVAMFDMGLSSATSSGNYDKARTFSNERLEEAKGQTYAIINSDSFPGSVTPSNCGTGCRRYDVSSVPSSVGLPTGSTYRITKQYLSQPNSTAASQDFSNSSTDKNLMKVTVRVSWNNNSYETSTVVAA